jgi:hypothetical protein
MVEYQDAFRKAPRSGQRGDWRQVLYGPCVGSHRSCRTPSPTDLSRCRCLFSSQTLIPLFRKANLNIGHRLQEHGVGVDILNP